MYTTFSILYHHITENCWRLSVCLPFSTAVGLLDSKAGCPSWGWTVLWPTGYFNEQMLKWLYEQYMENCPVEEEDDAQVGVLKSPPTHFHPAVFSSFVLNLHLQSAQHCLGHQAHKSQAAAESPGLSRAKENSYFRAKLRAKPRTQIPAVLSPFAQLSNYKQALLGHPYKLCRIFLHLPFYLRLSIKKALWKLLLSI